MALQKKTMNAKPKKLRHRVEIGCFEVLDLEGRLEDFLETFQELKQKGKTQKLTDLYVETQDDGHYPELSVVGTREETDKEYTKRLKAEKTRGDKQKRYDRMTYDRLKEKYGWN